MSHDLDDPEAPPEFPRNGGIDPDHGTAMTIFDLLDPHPEQEPDA